VQAAFAQSYDARADFSFTHNPNGVWTYGWSTELAGPLHVYPNPFITASSYNWGDAAIESLGGPHVAYNPHDVTIDSIPGHAMNIHPGPRNQFSHCVWKAPGAGVYSVQASFTSLSSGSPHAYVLKDGVPLGDSLLVNGTPWASAFDSVSLAAGDTIDAALGVGTDGSFFNDETQFSFTITKQNGTTSAEGAAASIARRLEGPLRALIQEELSKVKAGTAGDHGVNNFPVDGSSTAWQNSGVRVKAGQHVLVQAAAGDKWNIGWGPVDANGYDYQHDPNAGVPVFHTGTANEDWRWGALICAVADGRGDINDARREVEIGSKRGFTVDSDGYVYFLCNDNPNDPIGYSDNSGIIQVKVTVTEAVKAANGKAVEKATPSASAIPADPQNVPPVKPMASPNDE
jgi:hypothetical protein